MIPICLEILVKFSIISRQSQYGGCDFEKGHIYCLFLDTSEMVHF
jgi:hypothetical protein